MNHLHLKKIDFWVTSWGVIAIVSTTVVSGTSAFFSTLLGAALGIANWIMFRYVVLRMAVAGNKFGFGIFMGIKSLMILAVITATFVIFPIRPIPFIAGISSLFMGITSYFLIQSLKQGDRLLKKENENA